MTFSAEHKEIEAFMNEAAQNACEGLMVRLCSSYEPQLTLRQVKALDDEAFYVPAKRNWLKVCGVSECFYP